MHTTWAAPLALIGLLALLVTAIFIISRRRKPQSGEVMKASLSDVTKFDQDAPVRIVIGENSMEPMVTIEPVLSAPEYQKAQPVDVRDGREPIDISCRIGSGIYWK